MIKYPSIYPAIEVKLVSGRFGYPGYLPFRGPNMKKNSHLTHISLYISLAFWLGRLAFVSDGVSNNRRFEAERPPTSIGPPSGGRAATFVPYVWH